MYVFFPFITFFSLNHKVRLHTNVWNLNEYYTHIKLHKNRIWPSWKTCGISDLGIKYCFSMSIFSLCGCFGLKLARTSRYNLIWEEFDKVRVTKIDFLGKLRKKGPNPNLQELICSENSLVSSLNCSWCLQTSCLHRRLTSWVGHA